MVHDQPIIGASEYISLPKIGISDIPAKVDTGAETSAIWASKIKLKDGVLSFNFFAPGSQYYREKPTKVKTFRTMMVRNSFGHKEFRYKIKLDVEVGSHRIRRWFTLADRSRNTYPVLLGKDLLGGIFIVDVTQKNALSEYLPKKVLVLTKALPETIAFFDKVCEANKESIKYYCQTYDTLVYQIDGLHSSVNDATGADLATYDFTFFKSHHNHEFAFAAAEYLRFKGRAFADQEFYNSMSSSKLSETVKLVCHGLPMPKGLCAQSAILSKQFDELAEQLGLPFVLKEIASDKGKNNYLIQNRKDFDRIFAEAPANQTYMAQQYIENDGFYRLYVFGKDVKLAIWRKSVPHQNRLRTHLNKPTGSANASNVNLDELSGEAQELALRAAACLNRQIAGADLLQDRNSKKWYILEVNNDPQIRSGSFVAEKAKVVADYFERELNL